MRNRVVLLLCLLFAQMANADNQKSIGIFTYRSSAVKPWDPDSIKSGITGSEEAIIYMSEQLVRLGYKVIVFGDPPENSAYVKTEANPRYVGLEFDDGTHFDVAVAWRSPDMADVLRKRASAVYLWPHDTFYWRLSSFQINGFDDVFWMSQWHRKQWISVNPGFVKFNNIFGNGISPEQFKPVHERANPYSCIYGSNYARGLEILLDIWPDVKRQFPRATLDIYYGWQHWGLLTPEKEATMRKQIAELASLGVIDHGLVGHEELNRAYEQTSLWTYPCTAPETFCITALRAQMAGAVPVIIEGSALGETVRNGYKCTKQEEYLGTLLKAMQEVDKITVADRQKMGEFVLKEYTWKVLAEKWKKLFDAQAAKNASVNNSKDAAAATELQKIP